MQTPNALGRIVSIAELSRRSSLSIATLYRMMPERLDRPAKISAGRVGWSSDYIDAWLAQLVAGPTTHAQVAA